MPSVTMRELKQNPQAVVRKVLEADEPFHITSHGADTGVVIQPATDMSYPRRGVSGAILNAIADRTPLTKEQAEAWKHDIIEGIDDPLWDDPWERK